MKIKTFGNIILGILFFIIICLGILIIFSKYSIGGIRVLTVESGSMDPALKVGSVVFVYPSISYKRGDIITYRSQGERDLITHRIVEIDSSSEQVSFWTEGDANDVPDSYKVPRDAVIGKVRFNIPYLGYVLDFGKKPVGVVILIIIPLTILIYSEVQKIIKEAKRIKRKRKSKKQSEDNEKILKKEEHKGNID